MDKHIKVGYNLLRNSDTIPRFCVNEMKGSIPFTKLRR